jgi:hypothetical protein
MRNLGVKPVSGWSIDPFGHSSAMAYINKRAGMGGMVRHDFFWGALRIFLLCSCRTANFLSHVSHPILSPSPGHSAHSLRGQTDARKEKAA